MSKKESKKRTPRAKLAEPEVPAASGAAFWPADDNDKLRRRVAVKRNINRQKGRQEYVFNMKPKYLPNLRNLVTPLSNIDRIVLIPLTLQHYGHDPCAALALQHEPCASFEIPRGLFPGGAPLNKVIFLPPQLLPAGFDAGGVFGAGMLPRKFYPIGVMPMQQKGPTPPLFVGRRRIEKMEPRPVTAGASQEPKLTRKDVSIALAVAQPATLALLSQAKQPLVVQYNIYVPDLSAVVMSVSEETPLTMSVLSTVMHPHVPTVAFVTMSEESPRFELPEDMFPPEIGIKRPVFLPVANLPKDFDAGCVFAPGSIPGPLFFDVLRLSIGQPQFNSDITPPVFLGRWKKKQALPAADEEEDETTDTADETSQGAAAAPAPAPSGTSANAERRQLLHCFTIEGNSDEIDAGLAELRRAGLNLRVSEDLATNRDQIAQQLGQLTLKHNEVCANMVLERTQRQKRVECQSHIKKRVQIQKSCSHCGELH